MDTVLHFGQEYQSDTYQRFDYGYYDNMKKYGQGTPPKYDLKYVTTPVHLIWGKNDYLADALVRNDGILLFFNFNGFSFHSGCDLFV